jgi:hypothetical protein
VRYSRIFLGQRHRPPLLRLESGRQLSGSPWHLQTLTLSLGSLAASEVAEESEGVSANRSRLLGAVGAAKEPPSDSDASGVPVTLGGGVPS